MRLFNDVDIRLIARRPFSNRSELKETNKTHRKS